MQSPESVSAEQMEGIEDLDKSEDGESAESNLCRLQWYLVCVRPVSLPQP